MPVTLPLLKSVVKIEKSPEIGLGLEYSLRLAPGNIARVRLERTGPSRAFVHWVHVPPAFRGRGIGQVILARVLKDADREGVTISLVAKACGTMAQSPLERWYAVNGFLRRGKAKDGGTCMVRRPVERTASRRLRVA
jgi:GNAT superfamily N-acetyltransferase